MLDAHVGYLGCVLSGAALGGWIARRRLAAAKIDGGAPLLVLSAFAGAIGAGLTGGDGPGRGFSLLGGLVAFAAATAALARWARLPARALLSISIPPALIGLAVARLGCLFAGCCFGIPAHGGWTYAAGTPAFAAHEALGLLDAHAARSLPTFPYPLFDAAALFLCGLAAPRSRRAFAVGGVYALWRLLSDPLRGDLHSSGSTALALTGLLGTAWILLAKTTARPGPARPPRWAVALAPAALLLLAAPLVACKGFGDDFAFKLCLEACVNSQRSLRASAGRPFEGALALETRVGERLAGTLRLEGRFEIEDLADREEVRIRGSLRSLSVEVGGERLEGGGEVEATMNADGRFVLRPFGLSPELRSALKTLEPYAAGALAVDDTAPPSPRLDAALRKILATSGPRSLTRGVVEVEGLRKTFTVEARLASDELSAVFHLDSLWARADYRRHDAAEAAR